MKYFLIILITAFVFLSLGYGWAYKALNKPVVKSEGQILDIGIQSMKAISEAYRKDCKLMEFHGSKVQSYIPVDVQAQFISSDSSGDKV